jgi:hypothetical protein
VMVSGLHGRLPHHIDKANHPMLCGYELLA